MPAPDTQTHRRTHRHTHTHTHTHTHSHVRCRYDMNAYMANLSNAKKATSRWISAQSWLGRTAICVESAFKTLSCMGVQCIGSNVRAILGSSRKRTVGSDRLLYVYKYSRIAHEFKSHEWKANVCLCVRFILVLLLSTAPPAAAASAPPAAPVPHLLLRLLTAIQLCNSAYIQVLYLLTIYFNLF